VTLFHKMKDDTYVWTMPWENVTEIWGIMDLLPCPHCITYEKIVSASMQFQVVRWVGAQWPPWCRPVVPFRFPRRRVDSRRRVRQGCSRDSTCQWPSCKAGPTGLPAPGKTDFVYRYRLQIIPIKCVLYTKMLTAP